MQKLKEQLARIFDNNLRTKQWENYPDYIIIGLIVLSTLSVFISTFDVSPLWEKVLSVIDIVTVIAFTIEVTLRIWAADAIDDKYKGFWGRVRYCFTFYGLIDVLATYTFYIQMFVPVPYSVFKALRVLRLLRVFRYMHSFRLLQIAVSSKAKEMWVSLQFLVIVTLILSFVLFFYEHDAQPDVYDNGFKSVVWAFAQYVGDPGNFADTPPITLVGRIIACIIGLLGIALFAVPAGLIGAGFSEAMEDDKNEEKLAENSVKLHKRFRRIAQSASWIRDKGGYKITLKYVPRYRSYEHIQVRTGMTDAEIVETVGNCPDMRLVDLGTTQREDDKLHSGIAVAHFPLNNEYGCFIDRHSDVTIVAPVAVTHPGTGHFAFSLAAMGGFNYVSKELSPNPDDPFGFYSMQKGNLALIGDEKMKREVELQAIHFMDDLATLKQNSEAAGRKHWFIFVMGTTKSVDCQMHFWRLATDNAKELARRIVKDTEYGSTVLEESEGVLQNIFTASKEALAKFEVTIKGEKQPVAVCMDNCDLLKSVSKSNIMCRMGGGISCNAFTLRVGYEVLMFHNSHLLVTKELADIIKAQVEPNHEIPAEAIKCFMKEGDGYADDYNCNDVFEHNAQKLKNMIDKCKKELEYKYKGKHIA